jgi:dTDP-4-dehydrorhamnose reductase
VKILLTGMTGQVGSQLHALLANAGQVVVADRKTLDLASRDSMVAAVRALKPDLIVNAAAHTAVDRAESEPEAAMAVNATAPGVLAEEAKRLGAALVHFSTDYVFDGTKAEAYVEEDAPNPLNAYGRSKLAGEQAVAQSGARHLILRTSWVYDATRRNFLTTMLNLARTRRELRVVHDQRGAPTWSVAIAVAVLNIVRREDWPAGTYHLTCDGETTWFGFTRAILERARIDPRPALVPISTDEYPAPARRPKNSVLDNAKFRKAFGFALPHWESALEACLRGD